MGGYERDCDGMPKEGNLLTLFSRTIAVTGQVPKKVSSGHSAVGVRAENNAVK